MSKTLNRPMFRRGGQVKSRGTGIVANLQYNQGGRVGYQSGQLVTGGELLSKAQQGFSSPFLQDLSKLAGSVGRAGYKTISDIYGFGAVPSTYLFGKDVIPQTFEETSFGSLFKPTIAKADEPDKLYDEDEQEGGAIDVSGLIPKKELEPGTDKDKKTIDVEDSTTIDLKDFERDAAEYAKLLGIEKARGRDIGDMLARFSAAALQRPQRGEDRGLSDILADFMAMEAKTPSRTEAIEQAAGKLAITGKQAKDVALSKAQLKAYTDAYKTYAPAKEVKLYEFLKKKVGDQDALRIALGGEKNFATLLNKRAKDLGLPKLPTDSFKNVVREFYGESYEGDLPNIDQSKLDGVYTIPGTSRIVIYDKGKLRKDTTY